MAAKSNGSVAQVETQEVIIPDVSVAENGVQSIVEEIKAQIPAMFTLNIQSKTERAASQLRDGLRILYWQQFKAEQKNIVGKGKQFADNFILYNDAFAPAWEAHPLHGMNQAQIEEEIKGLGYTVVEINKIRSEYYESRKGYQVTAAVSPMIAEIATTEEIPY